jgi:uncharacterized protein YegP (UPF0339 family)
MKLRLHRTVHKTVFGTSYWFTLNGANGQVVMTSETYTRKASATKSLKKVASKMGAKTYTEIDEYGRKILVNF